MDYSGSCCQRPGSEGVPFDPPRDTERGTENAGFQMDQISLFFMIQPIES